MARTGGVGGEQLYRPQMGAAVIAVLSGGYLGHLVHAGEFGATEQVLAVGAFAALLAAGIQGAIGGRATRSLYAGMADEITARSRIATAQRLAAALLAVTAVCRWGRLTSWRGPGGMTSRR